MFGCAELVLWLALTLPSLIYVIVKTKQRGIMFLLLVILLWILLFVLCIMMTGGFPRYIGIVFNIK